MALFSGGVTLEALDKVLEGFDGNTLKVNRSCPIITSCLHTYLQTLSAFEQFVGSGNAAPCILLMQSLKQLPTSF